MNWIDNRGHNLTSQEVADKINQATGSSYTPEILESTFGVGRVYRNGGIWFQRVA